MDFRKNWLYWLSLALQVPSADSTQNESVLPVADLNSIPLPEETLSTSTKSVPQTRPLIESEKGSNKRPAPGAYGQWESAVTELVLLLPLNLWIVCLHHQLHMYLYTLSSDNSVFRNSFGVMDLRGIEITDTFYVMQIRLEHDRLLSHKLFILLGNLPLWICSSPKQRPSMKWRVYQSKNPSWNSEKKKWINWVRVWLNSRNAKRWTGASVKEKKRVDVCFFSFNSCSIYLLK